MSAVTGGVTSGLRNADRQTCCARIPMASSVIRRRAMLNRRKHPGGAAESFGVFGLRA